MINRRIELVPFDPDWSARYEEEMAYLHPVLGDELAGIHHIGSTAIPGIFAKPIIDILGAAYDIRRIDLCNPAMEALRYVPKSEYGIPGRRYFTRYKDESSSLTVHLHVYQIDHPDVVRHLAFRDYLNAHPEEAARYEALKLSLVEKYADERSLYTEGKSELIQALDAEAAAWREQEGFPPYTHKY